AELGRLELVPEIWLPDPEVRGERELARFRLHLVKHRTALKNRIHAVLTQHGLPCPLSDLFGKRGKELLSRYPIPEPWRSTVDASVTLIELLDGEIADQEREPRPALRADPRARPRPPRRQARHQDRRRHRRPQARRIDLVHAHPRPTVCSGRRRPAFDRVDGPSSNCATGAAPIRPNHPRGA